MTDEDRNSVIKWIVTPEGEILIENPEDPVPNHGQLILQQKGRDYYRALATSSDPFLHGSIINGNMSVHGYVPGDESTEVPRNLDPSKSWSGHVKVRNAVNRVREEATARGLPIQGDSYTIPVIEPGGFSLRNRPFTAALQGRFVDHNTGEEIVFHELSHVPIDGLKGLKERWEIASSDGRTFTLLDDGRVVDAQGNLVSKFNPYIRTADFEDEHLAPQLTPTTFEYPLPPLGIHFRTHKCMKGAGLSCRVTFLPGTSSEYPEGLLINVPGGKVDQMEGTLIISDYSDEHNGESIEGVPVTVETSDDPTSVKAVLDELGGRPSPNYDSLPENVRNAIGVFTRESMTNKLAEEISELYTPDEKKALKCPKCGSHSLRAFDVQKGHAELKCLTCGNIFGTKVFRNPESSTKEALGEGTYGEPGPQYPVDPKMQQQIIGLMQQIAQTTDETQKQQLQLQLQQLLSGEQQTPPQTLQPQQPQPVASDDKEGMRAPDRPSEVDQLRSAIIRAAGLSRISLDQNDRVNNIISQLNAERGGLPHQALQPSAYEEFVQAGAELLRESMMEEGTPEPEDTLENLFGIPEGGEGYFRDASVDPPDWFMIRLQEEVFSEILRESGLLKGAPYPENSYKNSPDHTPKGQKTWPKEVNAVYNACMREDKGSGKDKDAKQSSCAKIAWAQYKKTENKEGAAEAHQPGTRVEVQHPSNKGQRGSILKHKGTDSAVDEHTYDVLLDNGEKAEGLRESDIKRIKSAEVVDNTNLPTSTDNHFFGSMTFEAAPEFGGEGLGLGNFDDYHEAENPICPVCGGPGEPLGSLGNLNWYRCRNCGMDFNQKGEGNPYRGFQSSKEADGPPGAWPKSQQPKNPSGLPNAPNFDGNKTKFPYDPPAQESPYDEPDLSGGDVACPLCGGNAKSVGELNARTYHACSKCGMEFSYPNSAESEKWAPKGPEDLFGQDGPSKRGATDVSGDELKEGNWYILHGRDYKVPDVIKIIKLQDDHITAHFETDKEGQFPLQIEANDLARFTFDPYQRSDDPIEIDEKAQKSASGWITLARRNFSPKEQKDLVEENVEGRARNYDKLNLDGTHYQTRDTSFSLLDRDFLWQ